MMMMTKACNCLPALLRFSLLSATNVTVPYRKGMSGSGNHNDIHDYDGDDGNGDLEIMMMTMMSFIERALAMCKSQ